MLNDNAYKMAATALNSLRQKKAPRALWLAEGGVLMTPNTDWDVEQMQKAGAVLVGVFDQHMPSIDLAEAIIAADACLVTAKPPTPHER